MGKTPPKIVFFPEPDMQSNYLIHSLAHAGPGIGTVLHIRVAPPE
jgi:hypothetical protein